MSICDKYNHGYNASMFTLKTNLSSVVYRIMKKILHFQNNKCFLIITMSLISETSYDIEYSSLQNEF